MLSSPRLNLASLPMFSKSPKDQHFYGIARYGMKVAFYGTFTWGYLFVSSDKAYFSKLREVCIQIRGSIVRENRATVCFVHLFFEWPFRKRATEFGEHKPLNSGRLQKEKKDNRHLVTECHVIDQLILSRWLSDAAPPTKNIERKHKNVQNKAGVLPGLLAVRGDTSDRFVLFFFFFFFFLKN